MTKINETYELGFRTNLTKDQKKYFRMEFTTKSFMKGYTWMLAYLMSIYIVMYLLYDFLNYKNSVFVNICMIVISIILIIRQMRGLENIVHFCSHNNLSNNKQLNDNIANLFSAWPLLQDIKNYRTFHNEHHGDFGTHLDPCRTRLQNIGINVNNIKSTYKLLILVIRWMPQYIREFYSEIKSNINQVYIFMLWHGFIFIFFSIAVSINFAIFSLIIWMVSMFAFLPLLRSVAELSEHDYENGNTVAETTFNNIGFWDHALLHPAGDAWHALHHLFPTVSWWKQKAAHNYLIENDENYRKLLHRTELFYHKQNTEFS